MGSELTQLLPVARVGKVSIVGERDEQGPGPAH
jgi:hypothetical protein